MYVQINEYLKQKLPRLHALLKGGVDRWRNSPAPLLPVLKRVRGEFLWVHPQVLTLDTQDAEPHVCRWILESLRPGGTLFDVGAYCGWLSLKAARHVGRTGRVVAFEASPILVDILKYHQRRNRVPQMTVVGTAVSDVNSEEATFHLLNGGLSSQSSLTIGRPGLPFLDSARKTTVSVPSLTLDRYCRETGFTPDLIKIDVEGAELNVLRGASEILEQRHPILIVSLHPYWLPPAQTPADVFAFLAGHGYRVNDSHVMSVDGYQLGDYLLAV